MHSGQLGQSAPGRCIAVSSQGGARAWAFLPETLPVEYTPSPKVQRLNERIALALGGIDVLGGMLPNPALLINPFVRVEAVASTRVEGTRADYDDLLVDEAGESRPDDQLEADVDEVRNYVDATRLGWNKPSERPFSVGFLMELHEVLLEGVRGKYKAPGRRRDHLVHIGTEHQTISEARFVPPPPEGIRGLIDDLIRFVADDSTLRDLVRLALIHYQFETIHPFSDGNGRLGRLMMPLLLKEWGHLSHPLLFLSEYFERHRDAYIDHMYAVSQRGAWDEWIGFVLAAVESQSGVALERGRALLDLREELRTTYQTARAGKILTVIDALFDRPSITVAQAADIAHITKPAAKYIIDALERDGVLVERTGRQRRRAFLAPEIAETALGRPLQRRT